MLTETQIKARKEPGRLTDGRRGYGLSLLVRRAADGGLRRTWTQRLHVNGRFENVGLGAWPVVTLAMARGAALENARKAWQGVSVIEERRTLRDTPTFKAALESTIALRAGAWKANARTGDAWRSRLNQHAPALMRRRVDQISRSDVHRALSPVWTTKNETAQKMRHHIDAVLEWCKQAGHVRENVAEGVAAAMPKLRASTVNHPALYWTNLPLFRDALEASQANPLAKLAAQFMTLTAARAGEVRDARWTQIDGAIWSIEGADMKAGRAHRVPLSDAALRILDEAAQYGDGSGRVFAIGVNAIKALFQAMQLPSDTEGEYATAHGMRSSFSTWAQETGQNAILREIALAHKVGTDVARRYARGDMLEERGELMAAWAAVVKSA